MNKNIIITALIAFFSFGINAQSTIGVKLSAGKVIAPETSSLVSTDGVVITHEVDFIDHSSSYSAGLYVNKEFNFLFAQAEVLYSTFTSNYNVRSYIDDVAPFPIVKEKTNNLDLQILGGLKFNDFKLGVGPIIRRNLSTNSEFDNYDFYNERIRKFSSGFQVMLGYDFGPMTIDLKYEDIFRSVGDHIYFGDNLSKFNSDMSMISLGVGVGL